MEYESLLKDSLHGDLKAIERIRNIVNQAETDSELAIKFFEFYNKYSSNNCYAQYFVGKFHLEGFGTKENVVEGVKYAQLSSHEGFSGGYNLLGNCYENGDCLMESDTEAFKLYSKASSMGFHGAYNNMARSHEFGIGTPINHTLAWKWYIKSLSSDDPESLQEFKNFLTRTPNYLELITDELISQQALIEKLDSQTELINNLLGQLSLLTVAI
ncbi:MAG: hypothetical protein Harvfovirus1_46 [Harvfovirus sp.]|uniref:Sel1 repeat family protein n=1 Tax=Harvfovirus sp. TaxID=2487768 RepID=A0A3G5A2K2_9VIRU|nr:MAG: hypothetical protein Harvfovirus1_46 [Harvfovirus sp.]